MSQIYFIYTAVCLLASSQQYLFDICLLQYVQSLTPDDGRKDRLKHVKCYSNKINLRHWCIWLVLLQRYITMRGPMNVKFATNTSRSLSVQRCMFEEYA